MDSNLVVIDFSVLAFQMQSALDPLLSLPSFQQSSMVEQDKLLTSIIYSQMRFVTSLYYMDDERPKSYHVCFVMDAKLNGKYWRHDYLKLKEVTSDRQVRIDDANSTSKSKKKLPDVTGITYKANRKVHSTFHNLIRNKMYELVQREPTWSWLSFQKYEADDIIGALVHLQGDRRIWMITIDTDWMGLINPLTHWFCMKGYNPRVRKEMPEINDWAKRRLKTTLETPRDIYAHKARYGDTSDSLPAFSPIEVIDLLSPPDQYKLWLQPQPLVLLESVLANDTQSVGLCSKTSGNLDNLRELGVLPVIKYT